MVSELEKKNYIGSLLLIYGNMLSKTTYSRMVDFYLNDLSITEISGNENVSRNAVFESLRIGEKELIKYEDKLHLKEKYEKINSLLDEIEHEEDYYSRNTFRYFPNALRLWSTNRQGILYRLLAERRKHHLRSSDRKRQRLYYSQRLWRPYSQN